MQLEAMKGVVIPDLIKGTSGIHGKGLFAGKHYVSGDVILELRGELRYGEDVPSDYSEGNWLQVAPNIYLGLSGGFDDLINHSCEPNSTIRIRDGTVLLIAIRPIEPMAEIVFDYSLTMKDDPWEMICLCGSPKCRKIIREYATLPDEARAWYEYMKVVPEYVLNGNL